MAAQKGPRGARKNRTLIDVIVFFDGRPVEFELDLDSELVIGAEWKKGVGGNLLGECLGFLCCDDGLVYEIDFVLDQHHGNIAHFRLNLSPQ